MASDPTTPATREARRAENFDRARANKRRRDRDRETTARRRQLEEARARIAARVVAELLGEIPT